jgi:lipoprotein-anchoring transpeptidase ErfK/SrfK
VAALVLAGCGRESGSGRPRRTATPPPASETAATALDAARADTERAEVPVVADAVVRYGIFPLANEDSLRALPRRFGPESLAVVLRLNRVDLEHARLGDTLVVPSTFDLARLAPFPDTLPTARALPKLIVVSAHVQAFGAYEAGRLVRWGPTSTGRKEKVTPAGVYHTNWRQRQRISTFNDEWVLNWYINLSNFDGISLHQYELPGRPASHSCVRLLEDDAAWLYGWVDTWTLVPGDRRKIAQQGTPVVVMDAYTFGHRRPWKRLPEDPQATSLAPDSIAAALRRWAVAEADSAR